MGTLNYGASVSIFDPLFGATTSDAQTAPQMALIALGTVAGTVESFPDFGFDFDGEVGRSLDGTALAMIPQEVEQGLLAEPAFVSASVTPTSLTDDGDGGVSLAVAIQITGADGNAVGFTLASG